MTFYEIDVYENGKVVEATTKRTIEEANHWVRYVKLPQEYRITKTVTFPS